MTSLRVFLSSTALDLGAYRQIADDTLLRLQQQSVLMERFGAQIQGGGREEDAQAGHRCIVCGLGAAPRWGQRCRHGPLLARSRIYNRKNVYHA